MIQICSFRAESRSAAQFWDRDTLVSKLEARGLAFRRGEPPKSEHVVLLFAALESPEVASLPPDVRRRIVLVAEGQTPEPEEAESTREAAGLLGLVEPEAWWKWKHGPYVAWGFYGQPDIAAAAKLVPIGSQGLQPVGQCEPLPDVLARFLAAAESLSTR